MTESAEVLELLRRRLDTAYEEIASLKEENARLRVLRKNEGERMRTKECDLAHCPIAELYEDPPLDIRPADSDAYYYMGADERTDTDDPWETEDWWYYNNGGLK